MGKLCLRGDPRVCGQSAQCAFQARVLIAVGQRLAPMSKASTILEKGENYPQFFIRVNVLWRNTVHHGGDPGGLAQLSKRKFSTSCNAKVVAVRASSMQLLYSDANGYRQAAEAIGHTAEAKFVVGVVSRTQHVTAELSVDIVEVVPPPPGVSTTPARTMWTLSCSDAKSRSQELVLTLPQVFVVTNPQSAKCASQCQRCRSWHADG